jgi:hypothetical protein
VRAHRALWLAAILVFTCGCIAPVRWGGPAAPPDDHIFVGRHGRPIAYGGGVCPVEARHLHPYPPVPRAHFVDDKGAARDTRKAIAYFDPHPTRARTCFIAGLHYHFETPTSGLQWSDDKGAFRASKAIGHDGERP